jgi:hypothetical protein
VSASSAGGPPLLRARLTSAQGDPEIGCERITVYHEDGATEELMLHEYGRLYALPGVYEQIVGEDLGCRSPRVVADMLGSALDSLGRDRAGVGGVRVIDIAAGNGVSGEALNAAGMAPVLGTDSEPAARAAALRDRPGIYGEYLTLDLTALTAAQADHLRGLRAAAVTCVAPVGAAPRHVPPPALGAVARLLGQEALSVHLHDPRHGRPDAVDEAFWHAEIPGLDTAERVAQRRYLHRFRVTGAPYEMDAAVWRLRRAGPTRR